MLFASFFSLIFCLPFVTVICRFFSLSPAKLGFCDSFELSHPIVLLIQTSQEEFSPFNGSIVFFLGITIKEQILKVPIQRKGNKGFCLLKFKIVLFKFKEDCFAGPKI
ncbi:hypothetical protein ACOSQ3_001838 [Xanthoceras sorbifolium]